LWIPEEIGGRRNEEDPPWKSAMAQEKLYQEKVDQGQSGTRNLERTDAREEKKVTPGRLQRNKGPKRQTAAISQEGEENGERHRWVKPRTAITSGKRRNVQEEHL
jgi:hypothetical protein